MRDADTTPTGAVGSLTRRAVLSGSLGAAVSVSLAGPGWAKPRRRSPKDGYANGYTDVY